MSWLIPTPRYYAGIAISLSTTKSNVTALGWTITYAVGNPSLILWKEPTLTPVKCQPADA
jgi:hypothetical protein